LTEHLYVIPRSHVVYDSGAIMECVKLAERSAGGEVVLIGFDPRPPFTRQTDYAAIQLFLRDTAMLGFPLRPTDAESKRFRMLIIEEIPS
jgi:hypothetical protein